MKNCFLISFFILIAHPLTSFSNYSKLNISVGIGSLFLGSYLVKTRYTDNMLALKAGEKLKTFLQECSQAKSYGQDAYASNMKRILTEQSVWYFDIYGKLPYSSSPLHRNKQEIKYFFENLVNYTNKGSKRYTGSECYAEKIKSSLEQMAPCTNYRLPILLLGIEIAANGFELSKYLKR